ncbi:hypothetical protein AB0C34_22435 [Nocardia sp. NPDC049220]|uniref:hypothetical protein n=1 Tax=Nocardia sp. NPDC049220 TaxID=3155273 RepID=UPI0033C5E512
MTATAARPVVRLTTGTDEHAEWRGATMTASASSVAGVGDAPRITTAGPDALRAIAESGERR